MQRYQNHKDLMYFPDCGRKDLKYPLWPPILKKELSVSGSIFDEIHKGMDSRKKFFDKIIDVVTLLGGDLNDAL